MDVLTPEKPLTERKGTTLEVNLWPGPQEKAFNSEHKVTFLYGSKQSGKTVGGFAGFCKYISRFKNRKFMIVAPNWNLMDSSALDKFIEIAEPWGITSKRQGVYNKQSRELVCSDGNMVYLRVADNWEKLQSMTLTGAYLDEAVLYKHGLYEEILARLLHYDGRMIINFTVPHPDHLRGHWLYPLFKRFQAGDPNLNFIHFLPGDNPNLTEEKLAQIKETLTDAEWRAYYLGDMNVRIDTDKLYDPDVIRGAVERHPAAMREKIPTNLYDWLVENQPAAWLPERDWKDDTGRGSGLVVIGVDPSGEHGRDDTGQSVWYDGIPCATWELGNMKLTELEGVLINQAHELEEMGFVVMYQIDSTGLGTGIADHLIEQDVDAENVIYGSAPNDRNFYAKLKAELYFGLRELMTDPEFCLPDVPRLRDELLGASWKPDSNGKRQIKDYTPSADLLDALICGSRQTQLGGVQVFA